MMKIFVPALFYLLIAFNVSCKSASGSKTEHKNTSKAEISEAEIRQNLNYLASDELKGRATGSAGIEKAAEYIENFFKENNVKSYYKTYRDSFPAEGKKAFNIVGVLEGNDPQLKNEFIVIGAHYDHIGIQKAIDKDSIANGADDNAAGTSGVMELAKYFAEKDKNKRSMLFILFSGEELGLLGSTHIAKRLKSENTAIYAMLNLEMIGVPMQDKTYMAYLTGYENSNLAAKFNQYAQAEVLGFLPQAKEYNLFKRSDNYSFYKEFNVPAQTISTFDFTNYDYYHHVKDEAQNMDFQQLETLLKRLAPGILKMANTEEKEVKLNE